MLFKKYLVILPGIVLAFVLYSLSQGFNNIIVVPGNEQGQSETVILEKGAAL